MTQYLINHENDKFKKSDFNSLSTHLSRSQGHTKGGRWGWEGWERMVVLWVWMWILQRKKTWVLKRNCETVAIYSCLFQGVIDSSTTLWLGFACFEDNLTRMRQSPTNTQEKQRTWWWVIFHRYMNLKFAIEECWPLNCVTLKWKK